MASSVSVPLMYFNNLVLVQSNLKRMIILFTGIFFTMLTIALSSMMMITFRAGLYPIKEKSDTIAKAGETDVLQYQQQHVTEETKGEGDDEGALEPHKAVQIY